ncbi:MAG: hypothetical protein ACYTHJ_04950 [Planctomycetota bacterium]|jgi:hypothetical protein
MLIRIDAGKFISTVLLIMMGVMLSRGTAWAGDVRDMPLEVSNFTICLNGPGVVPAPDQGLTSEECLDLYDYDDDADVDILDYREYLATLPVDSAPTILVGDSGFSTHDFTPYRTGDTVELHDGIQGLTHIFITIRSYNLEIPPPSTNVTLYRVGEVVGTGQQVFTSQPFFNVPLREIGVGVRQTDRFTMITLLPPMPPDGWDGEEVILQFTVEVPDSDPLVQATYAVQVVLDEVQD